MKPAPILLLMLLPVGCHSTPDEIEDPRILAPEAISFNRQGDYYHWQADYVAQPNCFTLGPMANGLHPLTIGDINYLRGFFSHDKIAAYRADAPKACPDPRVPSCILSPQAILLSYLVGWNSPPELRTLSPTLYAFEPDEPRSETTQSAIDALLAFGQAKCR